MWDIYIRNNVILVTLSGRSTWPVFMDGLKKVAAEWKCTSNVGVVGFVQQPDKGQAPGAWYSETCVHLWTLWYVSYQRSAQNVAEQIGLLTFNDVNCQSGSNKSAADLTAHAQKESDL